jgi:hypothetical protein
MPRILFLDHNTIEGFLCIGLSFTCTFSSGSVQHTPVVFEYYLVIGLPVLGYVSVFIQKLKQIARRIGPEPAGHLSILILFAWCLRESTSTLIFAWCLRESTSTLKIRKRGKE